MKITLAPALAFHQIGQRGNQEDSLYPASEEALSSGAQTDYFIVCDGVGGAEKGEVASSTVALSLGKRIKEGSISSDSFANIMKDVYADLEDVMKKTSTRDMATTLTFVKFDENGAFAAHIGDSRIYHIRPGKGILYRSDDHSLVNAMVKAGLIKEEEAETHPQRNVITRCVGYVSEDSDPPRATTRRIADVQKGDWFVACSDGVLHCVSDNQFVDILSNPSATDIEKRDTLAKMSVNSPDNNTLYMVRIEDVDNPISGAVEGEDVDVAIPLSKSNSINQNNHKKWWNKIFSK